MLTLTRERVAAGWRYRVAGYSLDHFEVIRKIDWDDPASEPLWHVERNNKELHSTLRLDDAMDFVEATYELEQAE